MRGLAWLRQGFANIPGNALLPSVEEEYLGGQPYLFINNPLYAPITLGMEINCHNLELSQGPTFTQVIPARSRSLAFWAKPSDPQQAWSYGYRWQYLMGDHQAQPDGSVYDLPFAPGESFMVSQGHGGTFSHQGNLAFALDFAMPEGTPIYAAREGVVAAVETSQTRGGLEAALRSKANALTVLHPDGTLAHYAHLCYRGSLVSVGQRVTRGDMIGFSGNTGFSSGPHLHFHVYRALSASGGWESLPVQFFTLSGVERLNENTHYACPILQRR